jgi:hypothetical protein
MYRIGADLPTNLANSSCPTCGNELKDSLLPKDADLQPMKIEENISFLDAQKRMIDVFIEGQRKRIVESETIINDYKQQIGTVKILKRLQAE